MVEFIGKIHCGIFLLAYLMISGFDINVMFMIGGCIGSYLPDCDIKTSAAGKIIPLWIFWKHREQTHSLYFSIVCAVLSGVFSLSLGAGILIGMLLHCFMDCATTMGQLEGLRWFWFPYKNKYKETLYKSKRAI